MCPYFFKKAIGVMVSAGYYTHLRAVVSQMPGQRPCINALKAYNVVLFHVLRQAERRAPVAWKRARLLYYKTLCLYAATGFVVFFIHPVIADLGICHSDYLPLV